jgi:hypothetical protein
MLEAAVKIIVCGGRNIGRTNPNATFLDAPQEILRATRERSFINDYLTRLHNEIQITEVNGGDEGGAERIGLHWALVNKIQWVVWKRKNSKETMLSRNIRMINDSKANLVIAFGGGESTYALLNEAKTRSIEVLEIRLPDNIES